MRVCVCCLVSLNDGLRFDHVFATTGSFLIIIFLSLNRFDHNRTTVLVLLPQHLLWYFFSDFINPFVCGERCTRSCGRFPAGSGCVILVIDRVVIEHILIQGAN